MTEKDNIKAQQDSIIFEEKPWINLKGYKAKLDRGKPQWFIFLWWLLEGLIFPLTPHNFSSLRCSLLRLFGAKIGQGVVIRASARVYFPWKLEIGDYSWIGENVYIYNLDNVKIGSHTVISQKSYLCTGSHNIKNANFELTTAPIFIGNGVWIASDCFISLGVKIGANTIIGARSTVLKSIPSRKIAWGNPCKPIKDRIFSDIES
ncbi:WcaF family extracellular polysaccharide biosynthesis acetyltransferase [Cyanobacterium sp. Dongsha4]|uniref:WcaF family extracellular polysaccharide biosynthesis acetyltransferase n=1 Tax=Cyanobacterium sp. DS4 TaxID=2878255 RepID=UPI002E809CBD|nr:WcaF family extracellular polysaccharide biosynthesis acetyltransferase [Cyanobacterium sp. Dongsha4]WVL01582.1 putative colanic acid biosynthesis acetyltransferase [Cyanobacterium sp. Dongsha4]